MKINANILTRENKNFALVFLVFIFFKRVIKNKCWMAIDSNKEFKMLEFF